MWMNVCALLLVLSGGVWRADAVALMGIDFGSQWFKMSLVTSGTFR